MKISDLEIISFTVPRRTFLNGNILPEKKTVQTVIKISTDDGAEGHYFGGAGHGDHDGLSAD